MPVGTGTTIGPAPLPALAEGDRVDFKSTAYRRMECKWTLLHDLLGGTEAMRRAGTTWLPKEPKEDIRDYQVRLNRSVLYNGLKITIDRLVAKPFSRPITTDGSLLPAQLQPMIENVDKCGNDLTTFAKDVFRKALEYGLTHVLVDYPVMSPQATLADEINNEVRPVFVRIDPPAMLGWKTIRTESGSLKLTQIRFKETRVEPLGKFGDVEVEYIRVYNGPEEGVDRDRDGNLLREDGGKVGTWQVWKYNTETGMYDLQSEGIHTYPGVPLATYYVNRTGYMEGLPPLEDLMWINVRHWQVSSDVGYNLRMVLSAVLYIFGLPKDQVENITVGPNSIIKAENENAKCGYAEHSGQGLSAGREELRRLEDQMETLGLQPFAERTAKSTATGKILDSDKVMSDIQAWIRVLERFLKELFIISGNWIGAEIPDKFAVDVFSDFSIEFNAKGGMDVILRERPLRPLLSHETQIKELKRRGIIADDVDPAAEVEAIANELVLPPSDEALGVTEPEPDSEDVDDAA